MKEPFALLHVFDLQWRFRGRIRNLLHKNTNLQYTIKQFLFAMTTNYNAQNKRWLLEQQWVAARAQVDVVCVRSTSYIKR